MAPSLGSRNSDSNPLDTTFGGQSRRGEQLKTETHGGILEFHTSAFDHLMLSTVSRLARIAEKYPEALRFFPPGSKLCLSAEGDRGDYTSSGYLIVYCELKYPGSNGALRSSGREAIDSSGRAQSIETAFERFLRQLENKELDNQ